jgi:hypothetical protein
VEFTRVVDAYVAHTCPANHRAQPSMRVAKEPCVGREFLDYFRHVRVKRGREAMRCHKVTVRAFVAVDMLVRQDSSPATFVWYGVIHVDLLISRLSNAAT